MCFVRISEQTANFALHVIRRSVFITEVESVYSAVRTESLYNTDSFVFKGRKSAQQFVKVTFLNIFVNTNVCITNKPEKKSTAWSVDLFKNRQSSKYLINPPPPFSPYMQTKIILLCLYGHKEQVTLTFWHPSFTFKF